MLIRETGATDRNAILAVETAAFAADPTVPVLVADLLDDPSTLPLLSLIALEDDKAVGHILFTATRLDPPAALSTAILAPLAVIPEEQNRGIGGALIRAGLERLRQAGVALVFVLGHPEYYPRYGFEPAGRLGFEAPYAIPDEHADAWMVQALRPGVIGAVSGKVVCADALNKPEHWRE